MVGPKQAYQTLASIHSLLDDSFVRRPDIQVNVSTSSGLECSCLAECDCANRASLTALIPQAFAYTRAVDNALLVALWLSGATPTNADATPVESTSVLVSGSRGAFFVSDLCYADPLTLRIVRVADWGVVSPGVISASSVPLIDSVVLLVDCSQQLPTLAQ